MCDLSDLLLGCGEHPSDRHRNDGPWHLWPGRLPQGIQAIASLALDSFQRCCNLVAMNGFRVAKRLPRVGADDARVYVSPH